jgi:predicted lipoprotein with Yx(FWY)xxD motif
MMIRLLTSGAAVMAAMAVGACAYMGMGNAPVHASNGVLVDSSGMTLYTFDKDAPGKSVCNGKCAHNWPPLVAGADARPSGDYTLIRRDDGTMQWAYDDKPLYRWVKDSKPGDMSGDGKLNNQWHVVKQEASDSYGGMSSDGGGGY